MINKPVTIALFFLLGIIFCGFIILANEIRQRSLEIEIQANRPTMEAIFEDFAAIEKWTANVGPDLEVHVFFEINNDWHFAGKFYKGIYTGQPVRPYSYAGFIVKHNPL